jgi:tetratricopeptide (TPR) repeat protein
LLREAAGIIKREGMPDRALYGELLSYLAYVYLEGNQPAAAIEVTLESAEIEKELGVTDTLSHLNTLQNLATLWFQVGEVGKALAERERINQLSFKFYTAQDMEPSLIYNGAVTLLRMERPKDALAMLANHLERVRNAEEPAILLRLLHAKAWTHTQLGEWAIAEQALAETQSLLEQGAGNPALHSQLEVLRADIAVGRQDTAAARRHIDKALSICCSMQRTGRKNAANVGSERLGAQHVCSVALGPCHSAHSGSGHASLHRKCHRVISPGGSMFCSLGRSGPNPLRSLLRCHA